MGRNMGLDSISDNVQLVHLVLQSLPAGMGPVLGPHSKADELSRDTFHQQTYLTHWCSGYTGLSRCALEKLLRFESAVGPTHAQTQKGHREEWGMNPDELKDPGQVQTPRTRERR